MVQPKLMRRMLAKELPTTDQVSVLVLASGPEPEYQWSELVLAMGLVLGLAPGLASVLAEDLGSMVPVAGSPEELASRLGHRSFLVAMAVALLVAELTVCNLQVALVVLTKAASTVDC